MQLVFLFTKNTLNMILLNMKTENDTVLGIFMTFMKKNTR